MSNEPTAPFAVIEEEGQRHELYRDLPFEQFIQRLPRVSVDSIDFDTRFENPSIALVTVSIPKRDKEFQFTTTFTDENGESFDKAWRKASGNLRDTARGLFLIPNTVVKARTIVLELQQNETEPAGTELQK